MLNVNKDGEAPDDFYNHESEVDKEFLDIAAAVHAGGIRHIANRKVEYEVLKHLSLISCRLLCLGILYIHPI